MALPMAPRANPTLQTIEIKIDDGRREQREYLRERQAADNGIAERLADLRTGAGAEHQRHTAEKRRHGGHEDRPEAQHAGLIDRLLGAEALAALDLEGE